MNYSEVLFLFLKCMGLLVFFAVTLILLNRRRHEDLSDETHPLASARLGRPGVPRLNIRFQSARNLCFHWRDVEFASHYQLLERNDSRGDFKLVGSFILPGRESMIWTVPLHTRVNAQYILRAYNETGFSDSSVLSVSHELEENLRYLRSGEIDACDFFGFAVKLSAGGNTLFVAEDDFSSAFPRQNGRDASSYMGAAYVFNRDACGNWVQAAYINALAKTLNRDDDTDNRPLNDPQPETERAQDTTAMPNRIDAPELFFRRLAWLKSDSP